MATAVELQYPSRVLQDESKIRLGRLKNRPYQYDMGMLRAGSLWCKWNNIQLEIPFNLYNYVIYLRKEDSEGYITIPRDDMEYIWEHNLKRIQGEFAKDVFRAFCAGSNKRPAQLWEEFHSMEHRITPEQKERQLHEWIDRMFSSRSGWTHDEVNFLRNHMYWSITETTDFEDEDKPLYKRYMRYFI